VEAVREYYFAGKNFLKKVFPRTPFQKLSDGKDKQRKCRFDETGFL
jgi:hypothetical protein